MPGPLHGLLVADFSRVLAGPLATMTLGDLGAEVVKVERPGTGDETRSWAPPSAPDGTSTYYLAVNRNKRSVSLDLSTPEGREVARELALRADVLVENFAPGTMERFGLGYDDLAADNPRLVYASVTGFGRDSALPGYDFLIQAVGGLMSLTGEPDGAPTKVGVALVDVLAGQNLTSGVLAALYARERTGRGQRVEVNLLGSLLAALVNQASAYLNAGVVGERMGNRHPSIAPYETLRTADSPIVVAVGNDRQFARLCDGLATPRLVSDVRFADNPARVRHRDALVAELESVLRSRPAAHWVEALTAAGVPCGRVNDVAGAFALAERLGLDPVVRQPGWPTSVASPLRLSDTPVSYRLPPPEQGPPVTPR
ncbi:CaiB/BaiF CoA transferase family protein [Planosporangium sp. 12N6]|uniref:CaiB/BaiF CoA transferase family protein n=1 Tax=Planosporangium spinosum TaxID=3402278 RepID=UPI003CFA123C